MLMQWRKTGERIRALRVAKGLTQDELATTAGLSGIYVQKLEAGNASHRPSRPLSALLAPSMPRSTSRLSNDLLSERKELTVGVRLNQWKGAWWLFVHHKGQRRRKRVGPGPQGKKAAELAALKIRAKPQSWLSLGATSWVIPG